MKSTDVMAEITIRMQRDGLLIVSATHTSEVIGATIGVIRAGMLACATEQLMSVQKQQQEVLLGDRAQEYIDNARKTRLRGFSSRDDCY